MDRHKGVGSWSQTRGWAIGVGGAARRAAGMLCGEWGGCPSTVCFDLRMPVPDTEHPKERIPGGQDTMQRRGRSTRRPQPLRHER